MPSEAENQASARAFVRRFYAAGGAPSWTEWLGWSEELRSAAVEADEERVDGLARLIGAYAGIALGSDPERLAVALGSPALAQAAARFQAAREALGKGAQP